MTDDLKYFSLFTGRARKVASGESGSQERGYLSLVLVLEKT